jgi:hypothetical protein
VLQGFHIPRNRRPTNVRAYGTNLGAGVERLLTKLRGPDAPLSADWSISSGGLRHEIAAR